ncbi:hypothetical protein HUU51_04850 [Candidatus Gracilibacteria bacterium]|nr:hypothetical protein [Candidatus Gracilibacteria bacterium]
MVSIFDTLSQFHFLLVFSSRKSDISGSVLFWLLIIKAFNTSFASSSTTFTSLFHFGQTFSYPKVAFDNHCHLGSAVIIFAFISLLLCSLSILDIQSSSKSINFADISLASNFLSVVIIHLIGLLSRSQIIRAESIIFLASLLVSSMMI